MVEHLLAPAVSPAHDRGRRDPAAPVGDIEEVHRERGIRPHYPTGTQGIPTEAKVRTIRLQDG